MNNDKTSKQANMIKKKEDTPIKSKMQRVLAFAIIIVILVVGIGISKYLITNKPKTKKREPQKAATLVEVKPLRRSDGHISISGVGTVTPAKEIILQAQVAGTAIYVNPIFVPGGIIKKGDILIKIDDRDYKIQHALQENSLKSALADLTIEQGQQAVAANEWELIQEYSKLKDNATVTASELALRKPHLEKIKAAINSAKAQLELAELNLKRTKVKAPFNAIIYNKNVSLGSYISNQTAITTLTGIDEFWVEVMIPTDKLLQLNIAPGNTPSNSPDVNITYLGNTDPTVYKGKILKLLSRVDAKGLMASVLISVKDPLGLHAHTPPLLLGSSVKAEILGKPLNGYFKIPRSVLLDNDHIMIASPENTLDIRPINITWKTKDWVYVKNGLEVGEKLITSRIPAPINGMPIKLFNKNTKRKMTLDNTDAN